MDTKVLEFLKANHIGVLATILPDGMPHTAVLHFSQIEEPLVLYFSTDSESRKAQGILDKPGKASFTVGLSETEWITLQMGGEIEVLKKPEDIELAKATHYAKNPGSKKFEGIPTTIFMKFTPTWWRYTDFNTDPVTYITNK